MIRVTVNYDGDDVFFELRDTIWGDTVTLDLEETNELMNQLRDRVAEVIVHYETLLKLTRVEGEV